MHTNATIESCYNKGEINAEEYTTSTNEILYVGGIAGSNSKLLNGGVIRYCYNIGDIKTAESKGKDDAFGTICGQNNYMSYGTGTIENCYYLPQSSLPGIGASGESTGTNVESKNETAFETGEVAWLLHKAGGNFGQGLDEDGIYTNDESSPVLLAFSENQGKEVYKLDLSIEDEEIPTTIYRNAIESNLLPEDTYNEIMDDAAEGQDLVWTTTDNKVFSGNSYKVSKDETLTGELKGVYKITTVVTPEGAGEISNIKKTAVNGEEVSFSLGTTDGYKLSSVTMNEETLVDENADGIYTFIMPEKDVAITATFEKIETGGDDDDDEGGITTKRYQLFLADQDFYLNDEYDAEGLVLYSLHDKRYTKAGSSFTIWFEKNGEVNEGARVFISNRANGEYKEVKLDEVSGYYQIRNVQSNIYVKLYTEEGFPVANEAIEATDARAYAQANKIVVITPEPTDVQIISMAGAVVATAQVAGQQEFANLAEGVYIVRMGKEIVKLQVRN